MAKRVFLIVLDSLGIGALPDAAEFGDTGSNTLRAVAGAQGFSAPNLRQLGLFNIEGAPEGLSAPQPSGNFARMAERSRGKDTTTGHWEITGVISPKAMPTFPQGFPQEVIRAFEQRTGRGVLCNRPYSGTQVIADYGQEHLDTGKLIVYTSADSVFQIAAHESLVPPEELYRYCRMAREILQGPYAVGRVIARPFTGQAPHFTRTPRRHDFSLLPPKDTLLDLLCAAGREVIAVGKIKDIFGGRGVTRALPTAGNAEGIVRTLELTRAPFYGLCFVNLVDFDMLYGHRNDVQGYARALEAFDQALPAIMEGMGQEDILMITADHGCDPSTPSTDHSREYTPLLAWGPALKGGVDLGTRASFADIAQTVLQALNVKGDSLAGTSFLDEMKR
ncbi:phosphopentomutase [Christensenellaceae bacterium NSJ-44]|uniref:Phosphopentomutase n=1 Tax=Luoshenia tenuis TaxID=2763654 RepID=A0A926D0S4_9FIRM|nr:phosphopentomutase [Luoshenia tenuis]MBC8529462.1 phosphopentomutase [Luoshenia tenuis]